jgi:hypothetical protein
MSLTNETCVWRGPVIQHKHAKKLDDTRRQAAARLEAAPAAAPTFPETAGQRRSGDLVKTSSRLAQWTS